MLALLALCYWVISKEAAASRYEYKYPPLDSLSAAAYSPEGGGIWTVIFSWYCLLIHVLVFIFPLRACYAIWTLSGSLRRTARSKTLKDFKFAHRRRGSATSLSSSETLTSSHASSSASSEAGDIDHEFYADSDIAPDSVIHAIVIPNYKEEMDGLRETLDVLASHPQARNCYDVSKALPFSPRPPFLSSNVSNLIALYELGLCALRDMGREREREREKERAWWKPAKVKLELTSGRC